jgi:hypothetical protein
MNKLYAYLTSRLGKKTCPIQSISLNFDIGINNPFQQTLTIQYKDGTAEEFIEKPKYDKSSSRSFPLDR